MPAVPGELWPLVRVRSVQAGVDPSAYLARTLGSLGRRSTAVLPLTALPNPVRGPIAVEPVVPVIESDDALRAVVPAARHNALSAARDNLLRTLRVLYGVPDGDQLVSDVLSVLAQPFGEHPAGTVAYQRTTAMGVIDYLLTHIVLDPGAGTFALTGMPAPKSAAPARAEAADVDVSGALSAALAVAQNLTFALPPPWGPVAAAGIALLELLIPHHGDNPFNAAVKSIEAFIDHATLSTAASYLQNYSSWLVELQGIAGCPWLTEQGVHHADDQAPQRRHVSQQSAV